MNRLTISESWNQFPAPFYELSNERVYKIILSFSHRFPGAVRSFRRQRWRPTRLLSRSNVFDINEKTLLAVIQWIYCSQVFNSPFTPWWAFAPAAKPKRASASIDNTVLLYLPFSLALCVWARRFPPAPSPQIPFTPREQRTPATAKGRSISYAKGLRRRRPAAAIYLFRSAGFTLNRNAREENHAYAYIYV